MKHVYEKQLNVKLGDLEWNQQWWIWWWWSGFASFLDIRGQEGVDDSTMTTPCLEKAEHITFNLHKEILEIWIIISFTTVHSRAWRRGRLHNQCPLIALWIDVCFRFWQEFYPIVIPAGLACGVWDLTLQFDRAACFNRLAPFSLWNSWESNRCYRNFNSLNSDQIVIRFALLCYLTYLDLPAKGCEIYLFALYGTDGVGTVWYYKICAYSGWQWDHSFILKLLELWTRISNQRARRT